MNGKRKMLSTLRNTIVSSLEPTSNKKENQMNNDNDNRIELISLNEFNEIDENDIELGDEDERPFPDSDEAIRALQDVAEAVDEMEAECHRLRAELKTALDERDEARREVCLEASVDASGCYISGKHILVAEDRGWDCFKEESK